jgi:hypothetical protein
MPLIRSPRFRYTLRALLVFVTLFCLWGGYHANRAFKQRQARSVLLRYNASISSELEWPEPPWDPLGALDYGYQRLVQTIWRDPYVTHVSVTSPLPPEVIDALGALPHLRNLTLKPPPHLQRWNPKSRTPVLDPQVKMPGAALDRILGGKRLRYLQLDEWSFSEADFRAISRQRDLEGLTMTMTSLSEEGLAELITLPRLQSFTCYGCQVTGAQLAGLPGSRTLERIRADYSPVGVEFAAFIARSPHVTDLIVQSDTIDDDFIRHLGPHPSLQRLDIWRGSVTDLSVAAFAAMPALKSVSLHDTAVTEPGAVELKMTRPNVEVSYSPSRRIRRQQTMREQNDQSQESEINLP